MKKPVLLVLLALLFAHTASADPATLIFTSTASTTGTIPTGVTAGDPLVITIVADNGGAYCGTQAWGYRDIISVSYDAGGGAYTASIPAPYNADLETTGTIETGPTGLVTIANTNWEALANGLTDSNGDILDRWRITSSNDLIFTATTSMGAANAGGANNAALWTVTDCIPGSPPPRPPPSSTTAVPTMSTYGLILTTLGLLLVATRRLRISAKRD